MSLVAIPAGQSGDGRFTHDCPHRVVNDRDAKYADVERVAPSPLVQMLMDKGREHEDAVFAELEIAHDVVRVPSMIALEERVAETDARMRRGEPIVLGGALPDVDGRTGRPDVLIRIDLPSSVGKWSYLPCDVKSHDALDGTSKPRDWFVGSIASPFHGDAIPTALPGKPVKNDSLQLAHYWRMLESLGWTPSSGAAVSIAAIIDKNRRLVWRDLGEALWKHEDPRSGFVTNLSALQILDLEWEYRWSAVSSMLAGEPCTEPLLHGACSSCEWENVCREELDRKKHVSLIAGVTRETTKRLATIGVSTIDQLAGLDVETAMVIVTTHTACDLGELVERARAEFDPNDPVGVLFSARQTKGPKALATAGISTVGQLLALDANLIRIKSSTDLVRSIDAARVRSHSSRLPFLPRSTSSVDIPRADIEIDVDMENSDDVYLWGTYASIRNGRAPSGDLAALVSPGYHPFHLLDPTGRGEAPSRTEAEVFAEFWNWMQAVVAAASSAGWSVKFYCYTGAEYQKMCEIIARWPNDQDLPALETIDAFVSSDHWVDLKNTVEEFIWPSDSMSLKAIAPLAGFAWRAEDAGGDNSMLWYELAMTDPDPEVRRAMAAKLLEYNEDDVRATLVVREWLDDGLAGRGFTIRNVSEIFT